MSAKTEGIAPNASRLLWAGFMAILAAGVGFALRNGILDNWGAEYGFTATQLGAISGQGFTGFCFGIIIGGVIADKIGYGKLVIAAFLFHVLSGVVTFAATKDNAYNVLYWGMFIFALANGTLEAVANPLVATIYPHNRAHYLNILHASWPAGMILGTVAGWVLDDKMHLPWKYQLALYFIPTIAYGLMFMGQQMPKSEASIKGVSLGDMFKDVGILGTLVIAYLLSLFFAGPLGLSAGVSYAIAGVLVIAVALMTKFSFGSFLLFILFITHAMVGAVELGTDGWIQNITGNLFSSEQGRWLFIWTSALMFALRFCAHFIETKLGVSPVGLLLICAVLACVGLNLTSGITTFGGALLALGVYAVGKTFFWPTMLAVASDRYPRTGAVAISIMGGIGMLSAGLIGGPGLGYMKDRFAGEALQKTDANVYAEYKAPAPSRFLFLPPATGLDGAKFGAIQTKLATAREESTKAGGTAAAAIEKLAPAERTVHEASIAGDRRTLKFDSLIPATMAAIYLILLIYFKTIGGYKVVHIREDSAAPAVAPTQA
jgi:MFS family permease